VKLVNKTGYDTRLLRRLIESIHRDLYARVPNWDQTVVTVQHLDPPVPSARRGMLDREAMKWLIHNESTYEVYGDRYDPDRPLSDTIKEIEKDLESLDFHTSIRQIRGSRPPKFQVTCFVDADLKKRDEIRKQINAITDNYRFMYCRPGNNTLEFGSSFAFSVGFRGNRRGTH
jgi:hypothetical protein